VQKQAVKEKKRCVEREGGRERDREKFFVLGKEWGWGEIVSRQGREGGKERERERERGREEKKERDGNLNLHS